MGRQTLDEGRDAWAWMRGETPGLACRLLLLPAATCPTTTHIYLDRLSAAATSMPSGAAGLPSLPFQTARNPQSMHQECTPGQALCRRHQHAISHDVAAGQESAQGQAREDVLQQYSGGTAVQQSTFKGQAVRRDGNEGRQPGSQAGRVWAARGAPGKIWLHMHKLASATNRARAAARQRSLTMLFAWLAAQVLPPNRTSGWGEPEAKMARPCSTVRYNTIQCRGGMRRGRPAVTGEAGPMVAVAVC